MNFRQISSFVACLLSLCSCSAEKTETHQESSSDLNVSAPVRVPKANGKKIYAHVMPWFETNASSGTGRWGIHWTMANRNPDIIDGSGRRQIAAHYYPLIGPYASGDKDVVEYQLLLMKYAGVDAVLIDWPGTLRIYDYEKNRQNAEAMIALTSKVGLEFAIVYEDHNLGMARDSGMLGDMLGAARNDMAYMRDRYFSAPNYTRIDGAPLLLVFGPQTLQSPSDWDNAFSVLPQRPKFLTLWYEAHEANAAGEYSWIYQHNGHLDTFYARHIPGIKMGSVYPGYNTFYTQGGWAGPGWSIPHNGTQNFSVTLDKALASNANHVQLATWNDYGEGTMIEPTREFGYEFLRILQQKLGVSAGQAELDAIASLYAQRKQHAGNAAKQTELDQAFYHLVSLRVADARAILEGRTPPSSGGGSTPPNPSSGSYQIKNRWTGAYLQAQAGQVRYAAAASGASFEWRLEDKNGFKRLRNVGANCYVNTESRLGFAECTSVPDSFYSSYWTLESVGNQTRFLSAWTQTYLHIENQTGLAQHSSVPAFFESSQWSIVPR